MVAALVTEDVDEPSAGAFVSVLDPDADAEPEPEDRDALAVALTDAGEEPEPEPELGAAEVAGELVAESVLPIPPRTSLRLSLDILSQVV